MAATFDHGPGDSKFTPCPICVEHVAAARAAPKVDLLAWEAPEGGADPIADIAESIAKAEGTS